MNNLRLYFSVILMSTAVTADSRHKSSNHGHFRSLIIDTDQSIFQLNLLQNNNTDQIESCYEMIRNAESFQFCYPAINIAGIAKCGTSAVYDFLTRQQNIFPVHKRKEYCLSDRNHFEYFQEISIKSQTETSNGTVHVNGCINAFQEARMFNLLHPNAVYIIMVRDLASRLWASYNFWCYPELDLDCTTPGYWSKPGMHRSPEHFHSVLQSAEAPLSTLSHVWQHGVWGDAYRRSIQALHTATGRLPFVLAAEALEGPDRAQHIQRLQNHLNAQLGSKFTLDPSHLHIVNTGDNKGTGNVSSSTTGGMYAISGHQPMLQETADYIHSRWEDCEYVSSLANYPYKCRTV